MDYVLQPLTIQQTNWTPYIELYKELFACSPTRVLDEKHIKLDVPSALIQSMDYVGQKNKHGFISFMGTANSDMLIELANCTDIDVISKESTEERNVYIFIASANIQIWQDALIQLDKGSKHIRELSNRLLSFLRMAGYK
ncbi:MAG: hypothetical protein D4S01_00695 [Dehalococcoidia bacterium]|nr:MAG: hypothetical protein D4S01_00695 [Dehalococcoidia bacterium]